MHRTVFVLHCCFIYINEYKVLMPKVTYIEYNGKEHEVEVEKGLSIMEGAVQNGIPGIDADCGGACACATCHVYVKEEWLDKLSEQGESEKDMLDFAFETKSNSRLSCQLILEDKHDGIVVNLPEKQG